MNCTTCKWDIFKCIHCKQGLFRLHEIIENCHAWQEKERCECLKFIETNFISGDLNLIFKLVCRKCGRVIE